MAIDLESYRSFSADDQVFAGAIWAKPVPVKKSVQTLACPEALRLRLKKKIQQFADDRTAQTNGGHRGAARRREHPRRAFVRSVNPDCGHEGVSLDATVGGYLNATPTALLAINGEGQSDYFRKRPRRRLGRVGAGQFSHLGDLGSGESVVSAGGVVG